MRLRDIDDLPGPRGLPLVGNALAVDVERFHTILEGWADEHGPMYQLRLGPKRTMVTTDHHVMRQICRDRPDAWRRPRPLKRLFQELHTDGVFTAEGEAWRRQRKLMMAALSPRSIEQMFDPVCRTAERLADLWAAAADGGEPVSAHADFRRFAVDVATTVAFGIDVNTVEKGSAELRQYLEPLFPMINKRVNALVPYWRWFKLPSDRTFDRALDVLRDKVGELIADARKRLADDPTRAEAPQDLLEAMLAARDEDDAALRVTDEELFANALTVLIAGEDTTSNTAAWMFDHLARAPQIQARLRDEVRRELGPRGLPEDPRVLRKLPFVHAVAQETLRLRSAAPVMFFEANEPKEIGGVHVEPDDLIILLTRKAACLESTFADAMRFDPARWLDGERNDDTPHDPTAMLAFGYGPRICPGRSLALLELALLAAVLPARFELSPGPGDPPEERFSFTMTPTAVPLRVRRLLE